MMKRILLLIFLLVNLQLTMQDGDLRVSLASISAQSYMYEELPEVEVIGNLRDCPWGCGTRLCKTEMDVHEQNCDLRMVECPSCHQKDTKSRIDNGWHQCGSSSNNEGSNTGGGGGGHSGGGVGHVGGGGNFGGWGSNTGSSWASTLYSPKNGETLIPNYKIPTEWRGQLPEKYACFLCCMEYIWNIQHSTPDYRNSIHINGNGQYDDILRKAYYYDYVVISDVKKFEGVKSSDADKLLSYEGFQYVEIKSNEIKSYLDNQYLIILCYPIYNNGKLVSGHAVLVVGYDKDNNLIVVDPATGAIRKIEIDSNGVLIIAISPYTSN